MSTFTVSVRNTILNWLSGKTSMPAAATRYLSVCLGDPQAGGVEVINTLNGSPSRLEITSAMGVASDGIASNTAPVTVVTSAVDEGTVNYAALYDAATGGNLMGSSPVKERSLIVGDSLTIPAGALSIGMI